MPDWKNLNDRFKTTIDSLTKKDWQQWKQAYEKIELTPEEVEAALLEAKKKKWFHEKNKDYWEKLESPKGKTRVISYLSDTEKKECISPLASPKPGRGSQS